MPLQSQKDKSTLRRSPLFAFHSAHARIFFLNYLKLEVLDAFSSAENELQALRSNACLFDMFGIKIIRVKGSGALQTLDHFLPRTVTRLACFRSLYSPVLTEQGTIASDLVLARLDDQEFWIMYGGGQILPLLKASAEQFSDVSIEPINDKHVISLQGPRSTELLSFSQNIALMKYFDLCQGSLLGCSALISRSGYSGEKGYEIIVDRKDAETIWNGLLDIKNPRPPEPAGFSCFNTARIEAGFPCFPIDMDASSFPSNVGLGWTISKKETEFRGKQPAKNAQEASKSLLIGLFLDGRVSFMPSNIVHQNGNSIGKITSSCYSFFLKKTIAFAKVLLPVQEKEKFEIPALHKSYYASFHPLPFIPRRDKT